MLHLYLICFNELMLLLGPFNLLAYNSYPLPAMFSKLLSICLTIYFHVSLSLCLEETKTNQGKTILALSSLA
jgi:hypothetical protein